MNCPLPALRQALQPFCSCGKMDLLGTFIAFFVKNLECKKHDRYCTQHKHLCCVQAFLMSLSLAQGPYKGSTHSLDYHRQVYAY